MKLVFAVKQKQLSLAKAWFVILNRPEHGNPGSVLTCPFIAVYSFLSSEFHDFSLLEMYYARLLRSTITAITYCKS